MRIPPSIRLVRQEAAPKKCVFVSTSKKVKNDMKGRVVSDAGDRWTVKLDVRGLGSHLDSTFRARATTLGYRIAAAVLQGSLCLCSSFGLFEASVVFFVRCI